jgi:hypothetical protein
LILLVFHFVEAQNETVDFAAPQGARGFDDSETAPPKAWQPQRLSDSIFDDGSWIVGRKWRCKALKSLKMGAEMARRGGSIRRR